MISVKKLALSALLVILTRFLAAGELTISRLDPKNPNQIAENIFSESFDGSPKEALYDAKNIAHIALVNNTVIGIAIYRDLAHDNGTLKRYLYNFAITQSERKKGYGREFMRALIADAIAAKNIHSFELDATPESKQWYHKIALFDTKDPDSTNMVINFRPSSPVTIT